LSNTFIIGKVCPSSLKKILFEKPLCGAVSSYQDIPFSLLFEIFNMILYLF